MSKSEESVLNTTISTSRCIKVKRVHLAHQLAPCRCLQVKSALNANKINQCKLTFTTHLIVDWSNVKERPYPEVQTHRQPLWHCVAVFLRLVGVIFIACSSSCTHICYVVCICVDLCESRVCTACVSHAWYRFQPERRCNHRPQPISEGQRPVPYFKSQLCEGPRPPKSGTNLLILSKPGERTRDSN